MKLKNKYFIMRHGQALSNVRGVCSNWPEKFNNPLTEYGQEMVRESAEKLKAKLDLEGQTIDVILCSPLLRTKQTAQIAGKILNNGVKIKVDKRLREIGFGKYNGKDLHSMWRSFKHEEERINKGADGGETYTHILDRMFSVVKDIEKKYKDRNVMLISHEGPSFLLQGKFMGLTIKQTIKEFSLDKRIHKAEIRELN
ncbi:MAG: histidine phosphatase family protein [Candidatus Staskawiczbacteria bacterium]|nr:histidine phosphatase family protein [Candidatus Staskawiczbacteria bacterium]